MSRWTMKEFETLLRNPALSDEELAAELGTRAPGAVAAVRGGVDAWHKQMTLSGLLSQAMVDHLGRSDRERYRCAVCNAEF